MDDFEVLNHEILSDPLDKCSYVIHSFTTNRNCKRYILDEVETLIDSSNFQIRYPRGDDFKVELYDDIVSGNLLEIGTDGVLSNGSNLFFYISQASNPSIVLVRFTYVEITMGDAIVKSTHNDTVIEVGDFFDLSINIDNDYYYQYQDLPFSFTNLASESRLKFNMRILSSNLDNNPSPDNVDLGVTLK